MNLSPRWVSVLVEAGIEAVHWSNVGSFKAPDTEIMAHARAHGYIVLSHDLDFSAILATTNGDKPSVVQIRSDNVNPEIISQQVISALRQMQTELLEGALLVIDPQRTRIRLLPLRTRG